MTQRITIPIIRDTDYLDTDTIDLEIDGVEQRDRIKPWDRTRAAMGYGMEPANQTGYGFARSLPYGTGLYGLGIYGQGVDLFEYETTGFFVPGDYQIRIRGFDKLGNTGPWSPVTAIAHRPLPPPPTDLDATAGVLSFQWSDPL